MNAKKRIGILSSGGDCPGINAVIRAVGKSAILGHDMEVIGLRNGFSGIIHRDYMPLDMDKLSGLLHLGGTILGTSREKTLRKKLQKDPEFVKAFDRAYKDLRLDAIVAIGGNGTQKTAMTVSELGYNVVGVPKTIDNDVWGTDVTFGFDTAVSVATEAIDRLHSTAESHGRVMVVEVMGHSVGWIALHAGMAGGADVILLPELGYNIEVVEKALLERARTGKKHSIVVVAEGLVEEGSQQRAAQILAKLLNERAGLECRETVLGYVQRGGGPSAADRNICTRMGAYATSLIEQGTFGVMVAIHNNNMTSVPLSEVAGRLKTVSLDNDLLVQGKAMGICFGVE